MGIDGIGKGGAPPVGIDAHSAGSIEKTAPVDKTFSVERPDAAEQASAASGVHATDASSPLARLRSGELDLDGYLDRKVEDATRHLSGLSAAELSDVKQLVREQLVTDPALVDLVRTATGQIPTPPEE